MDWRTGSASARRNPMAWSGIEASLFLARNQPHSGGHVEVHSFVVNGATAGPALGLVVIARNRFTPDRLIQRRQCRFGVDAAGPVDLYHHVDVKVSLGIVPRGGI